MKQRDLERLSAVRVACRNGQARAIRVNAGLTQDEIAQTVRRSQTTVALWESGQRVPRGEAALRYADVLESLSKPPVVIIAARAEIVGQA